MIRYGKIGMVFLVTALLFTGGCTRGSFHMPASCDETVGIIAYDLEDIGPWTEDGDIVMGQLNRDHPLPKPGPAPRTKQPPRSGRGQ